MKINNNSGMEFEGIGDDKPKAIAKKIRVHSNEDTWLRDELNAERKAAQYRKTTIVDKAFGLLAFTSLIALSAIGMKSTLGTLNKGTSYIISGVVVVMLSYVALKNINER